MPHSTQHHGLQQHSVGEIYPWTVRIIDGPSGLRCQAFHCLTGETGIERYSGKIFSFQECHRLAENDARRELGIPETPLVDALPEPKYLGIIQCGDGRGWPVYSCPECGSLYSSTSRSIDCCTLPEHWQS